jgi:hypothetical protein
MTFSRRYHIETRKDGVQKRLPHVLVGLKGKNSEIFIDTYALVDSGADISVIPKDFAELIGVDIGGPKGIANGLGGEVEVVNSKMELKIKGDRVTYDLNVPVQVILSDSKIPVILGRDGFFSYFRIEFDHANSRIKFVKNDIENFKLNNIKK